LSAPLGYPDAPDSFGLLVNEVVARSPFTAPLGDIVAWRRARRSIRIRGVAPDGSIDARAELAAPWPLTLEDVSGRAREIARPAAA
jgi:hypothetical protein